MKKLDKFPAMYNNHLDLGKSSLIRLKSYDKPDSLVYADRLATEYKGKKGYMYFFTYKTKKDDLSWKMAVVGLVPENPREFEFEDSTTQFHYLNYLNDYMRWPIFGKYNFTRFTDVKVSPGEAVKELMRVETKKMLYERRKSAAQFYGNNNRNYEMPDEPEF